MTLRLDKTFFFQESIQFLGYNITVEGIKLTRGKVEEIDAVPPPKNIKQLRRFLGIFGYYSRFYPNYAFATHPLLDLLRKSVSWKWEGKHQAAFERIKATFLKSFTISHPDFTKHLFVQTDSSDVGLGTMLYQIDERNKPMVISLISRVLRKAERNYTTTEKEMLAIIWALEKWRPYLLGTQFTLLTDHQSLIFLQHCHTQNQRLLRWVLFLQQYDFKIQHCRGVDNHIPDLLSRHRHEPQDPRSILSSSLSMCPIQIQIDPILDLGVEEFLDTQRRDPLIQNIAAFKQGSLRNDDPQHDYIHKRQDKWGMAMGIVLQRTASKEKTFRILVPRSLAGDLVRFYHTKFAHFGATKMYNMIADYFVWRGMKKEIRILIAKCDTCQKSKHPNRNYEGDFQPIIPPGPNNLAAVDLYGPLPKYKYGNKFLLVIVDVFSKLTQFYPLKKPNTNSCFRGMQKFVTEAGPYQRVLTDQGTQFTRPRWASLLRTIHIEPILTTPRHPQSNPTERIMREISRVCRVYCSENHRSWDELIPHLNIWLNSIPHCSTTVSA